MLIYAQAKDTMGNRRTTNSAVCWMELLSNCEDCNLVDREAFINTFYKWNSEKLEFVKNENQICDYTIFQCLKDNKACYELNIYDENDNIIEDDDFDVTGKYAPCEKGGVAYDFD